MPGNALTFEGLFVDNATTGMLNSHNVLIQGTEGHFTLDGDVFKATDYSDVNKYTEISPNGAYFKKGIVTIENSSGRKTVIDGQINRSQTMTPRMPRFKSAEVHDTDMDGNPTDWYRTNSRGYAMAHTCLLYTSPSPRDRG